MDVEAAMTRALASRPELDAAEATASSAAGRRPPSPKTGSCRPWTSSPPTTGSDSRDRATPPERRSPGCRRTFRRHSRATWATPSTRSATAISTTPGCSSNSRCRSATASARANARIAANTERQAEADLSGTQKAIRAEILDAAAALETAAGRIDAARAEREAAQIQLSAEQDRFSAGLSTNFLVLTRQNDLASARLSEIQALTDYRAALRRDGPRDRLAARRASHRAPAEPEVRKRGDFPWQSE